MFMNFKIHKSTVKVAEKTFFTLVCTAKITEEKTNQSKLEH